MLKPISLLTALVVFSFGLQPLYAAEPFFPSSASMQPETAVDFSVPENTLQNQPQNEGFEAGALSAATAEESSGLIGVQSGQTVSGVIDVRPDGDQIAGIRKVAYYLNGAKSGKVYQSPFIWGGVSGDGTNGFDTKSVSDGDYVLAIVYTDNTGDHTLTLDFKIDNSDTPPDPQPTPNPTTSLIAPSGRTAGGLQFPSAQTSFVDIEHAGSYSFLANQNALYIVNAANAAQPSVVSTVGFSAGPLLDIVYVDNAVFVLERGPIDSQDSSPSITAYDGNLYRIDVTNPASPVKQLVRANISTAVSLSVNGSAVTVVTAGDQDSFIDCPTSGGACGLPRDLYCFRDLAFVNAAGNFSVERGDNVIRNTPGAANNEDFSDIATPAPIAYLSGSGNHLFVALTNGTTLVYDTAQKNPATGIIPVLATIDPQGASPIFSVVEGNRFAVLDASGLIEVYDISNTKNPLSIDSLTVAGARSLAFENGNLFAVTVDQYRIITAPSTTPPINNSAFVGVQEGQTVSGTVNIGPNQTQLPNIRKVAYYLNGAKSGKVYSSPFLWGGVNGTGSAGFDTRGLTNGNYALAMVYTDSTGDHIVSVNFTVDS